MSIGCTEMRASCILYLFILYIIYYCNSSVLKVPHSVKDHPKTVLLMNRSSTWRTPVGEDYFSPTVKWVRHHVKLSYLGRHSETTEKSKPRARQGKLSADSRWAEIQDQMTAANLSACVTGRICWCRVLTDQDGPLGNYALCHTKVIACPTLERCIKGLFNKKYLSQ